VEVEVEHWTCPGEWGWGKEPNSQWTNTGKAAEAESWSGVRNQPTTGTASNQQGQEGTKAESRGGVIGQPPEAG
jgi:hypothetical protein